MKLSEAHVLIVDDEPALCDIFTQWVEMSGCQSVRSAADGEAALAAILSCPVDILITDVRMPIMNGITLVHRLHERGVNIPSIVFVSGFADVDVRQMYELGVEAFLAKPLTRGDLISCIERALAERSSLWLVPLSPSPRQNLNIDVADANLSNMARQADEGSLCFGRGGFCVQATSPLGLGGVNFACRFPVDAKHPAATVRILAGQGYVRWFSRSDLTAGIEFAYLESSCRAWVIEEISKTHPFCFIPGR